MKLSPIALAVAGVLAAGTSAQAQGQLVPTPAYTQALSEYQQKQADYQAQVSAYEAARLKYEQDRAAYDARWGVGAYARAYGPFTSAPVYSSGYGTATVNPYATTPYVYPGVTYPATTYPYASTYPYTGTATYPYSATYPYTTAPYAGGYGVNASYGVATPCVGGSGSLNMAALSAAANASLAGKTLSGTTEVNRAVLGAVVDRAIGTRAVTGSQCDANGYFYTVEQTQPYREGYYDAQGRWVVGVTSAYASCRIAPAPTDANADTWRFVKVCPDASGRFRISA